MERDVFAQKPVVVAQTIRETTGFRVQQNEVGIDRGGVDEDDFGVVLRHLFGVGVYHTYTRRLVFLFVKNDGMHHGVGLQGQFSGLFRPGNGRGVAAEIPAKRTAALTDVAVLAFAPPLLQMDGLWLGQVRTTPNDDGAGAVVFFGHRLGEVFFHAGLLVWGQKLAVGQLGQTILVAGDARKQLYITVPRGQFRVGDRPLYRKSIAGWAVKIVLRPALRPPRPHERFSAHLITPNPVEGLFLDVGMLSIFDKKVSRTLSERVTTTGDGIGIPHFFGDLPAVFKLPWVHIGGGVILNVFYVGAALQQEGLQALARQFFG